MPYFVSDWRDILWVFVIVSSPGLFPWFMGTLAGVCLRSKRLGIICAVSFAGGIGSWLLTLGWVVLTADRFSFGVLVAGFVAVPLLAGAGLAVWAVLHSKRAARRAPGPTDLMGLIRK